MAMGAQGRAPKKAGQPTMAEKQRLMQQAMGTSALKASTSAPKARRSVSARMADEVDDEDDSDEDYEVPVKRSQSETRRTEQHETPPAAPPRPSIVGVVCAVVVDPVV